MATALCCCFSGEPLNQDEAQGRRGGMYAKYLGNREKFQLSMGDACCKEPGCCLLGGCPICFCCTTHHMRYKVLNHVSPNSGWDHYICCQGYTGPCCCFTPGACCEKELPRTCMCCEIICCPGLAVSTNRFVMMDHYQFTPDECDNRLIRFNNCIQILSCICHILAIFNRDFQQLAAIIDLIADIVFFSTAGCMTAQVNYEVKYRESLAAPVAVAGGPVVSPAVPPTATVVGVVQPPPPGAPPVGEDMSR